MLSRQTGNNKHTTLAPLPRQSWRVPGELITKGAAGTPYCRYCRQRLWMFQGGCVFAKCPRLQCRHWRQPNKQHKPLCKLLWSCVWIRMQSGDLWEQPVRHKPAGLKIAQEPSTERNTEEPTGPLLWQSPFSCTGSYKALLDPWGC